ncbi:alpha/beta hydrolase [Lactiplantibacillus plantarum]|uniref:alpha/beta hydrolase n=1 Tax=Lactiplantibacillus plantarum TaxID=1590 RepID=UPI002868DF63|nr:alpha/beta hydrolase [Lactiplantibacillus plantarum]WMX72182.1 alpha/beta hydrolase [Lactiplantibacillus plantarum]
MIKALNIVTKTGTELQGTLFKAAHATTVLIAVTGVHGNFYSNPFYVNIGKTLMAAGIDFIYAQTRDAFNQVVSLNHLTGKKELVGSWSEQFDDANEDIAAYLSYAEENQYQHIILGGHSLGANKVIYYLANHADVNVTKFLLLSPANLKRLTDMVSLSERNIIQKQIAAGNSNQLLPFELFGWLPCTAKTADQWLNSGILDNVHSDLRADFSQIERIRLSGAMVIGTLDTFTYGDPIKYLKTINAHFLSHAENDLVFIQKTGHTYQNKDQKLANEILKLIKNWSLGGN